MITLQNLWVPSPNGSGGAPRQGWINATDGNLYRLWFFTFAQGFNQLPKGSAYLGSYTLLTPLSRCLTLITKGAPAWSSGLFGGGVGGGSLMGAAAGYRAAGGR